MELVKVEGSCGINYNEENEVLLLNMREKLGEGLQYIEFCEKRLRRERGNPSLEGG